MKFLRYLIGFPFAVIITSLLFVFMYHLIRQEQMPLPEPLDEIGGFIIPDRSEPPSPPPPPPADELPDPPPEPVTNNNQDTTVGPARETIDPGPGIGVFPTGPGGGGGEGITIISTGFYPVLTAAPLYPASCEARGVEGTVTVKFDVTNGGEVTNAVVVSSTDSCFERAALRAIEKWQYSPLTDAENMDAIRVTGERQTFVFELEDE